MTIRDWFKKLVTPAPKQPLKRRIQDAVAILLIVGLSFFGGFKYGIDAYTNPFSARQSITPPAQVAILSQTQVLDILNSQPRETYRKGYNCVDYAWNAMRALIWNGQPSAVVSLDFEDGTGHTIIMVATSNQGYQFIEPQSNTIVTPEIGGTYAGKTIKDITVLVPEWVPLSNFQTKPSFGIQGGSTDEK